VGADRRVFNKTKRNAVSGRLIQLKASKAPRRWPKRRKAKKKRRNAVEKRDAKEEEREKKCIQQEWWRFFNQSSKASVFQAKFKRDSKIENKKEIHYMYSRTVVGERTN